LGIGPHSRLILRPEVPRHQQNNSLCVFRGWACMLACYKHSFSKLSATVILTAVHFVLFRNQKRNWTYPRRPARAYINSFIYIYTPSCMERNFLAPTRQKRHGVDVAGTVRSRHKLELTATRLRGLSWTCTLLRNGKYAIATVYELARCKVQLVLFSRRSIGL